MGRGGKFIFLLCVALVSANQIACADKINWEAYSTQKVQAAIAAHKPIVIDYSAEWCPGCHVLEQTVFSDPQIKDKFAQLATLRVDATDMESPEVQSLLEQYDIIGLPTVLFLDGKGREIRQARIEGAGDVEDFLQSLQVVQEHNPVTSEHLSKQ